MLKLTLADQIADLVLAKAHEAQYAPLTVAVLDSGGHLLVLKRDDGSGILRPQIAEAKAWGVLGLGIGGRGLAEKAASAPAFVAALGSISGGRIAPVPGGVLLRDDEGVVIGAVGVSGDTSDHDEECAIEAIVEVGLVADPG